jgi:hypothetical protein
VNLSVTATERSWQALDLYTYMERDEDRRLNSLREKYSHFTPPLLDNVIWNWERGRKAA